MRKTVFITIKWVWRVILGVYGIVAFFGKKILPSDWVETKKLLANADDWMFAHIDYPFQFVLACALIIGTIFMPAVLRLAYKLLFDTPQPSTLFKRNTIANSVSFKTGTGGDFETTKAENGCVSQTVRALVDNTGDGVVANCRVIIKADTGSDGATDKYGLQGATAFDLLPNVPKPIDVAFYHRWPNADVAQAKEKCGLCVMQCGFYNPAPHNLSVTKEHIITLCLESSGQQIYESVCKLWNDGGKLRLERV
jgi:hypothetical protein